LYVEQNLAEVLDGHVRGAGSAFVGLRLLEPSGRGGLARRAPTCSRTGHRHDGDPPPGGRSTSTPETANILTDPQPRCDTRGDGGAPSTTRTMSEPITVSSEPTVVPEESRLQAVFLDMDGTLIESEGLWNESEAELVAELGGVWTEEDHRSNVGNAAEPVGRYIIELTGAHHLRPRQVADQLYARFRSKLAEGAEVRPGAHELVRLLADSPVPVVLVTSTERSLIETSIKRIGLD